MAIVTESKTTQILLTRLRQLLDHRWFVRFRQDRSIREALYVFLLTRIFICVIFLCVGNLQVVSFSDSNIKDAVISLKRVGVARTLRSVMSQADVLHYVDIARYGYRQAPFDSADHHSQQFAFFPLFPILLWLLGHVTNDVVLWSAALCNLFFFLALVLLYKLTLAFGYDESVARRTLFYLAVFPVSYFFSMPFTESLFVLLTVASFYAARREHWWVRACLVCWPRRRDSRGSFCCRRCSF